MQRNWIGRSDGRHVDFAHRGPRTSRSPSSPPGRTPCTARRSSSSPPTPPLAEEICAPEQRAAFEAYRGRRCASATEIERLADRPARRPASSWARYAINPVNGERMPVWAADYVLADYGTGAIMAVPAHDQRDLDFAPSVRPAGPRRRRHRRARPGRDRRRHPRRRRAGQLRPAGRPDARPTPSPGSSRSWRQRGLGEAAVNYRLRDWLLSRQRFWGRPIPIIHCPACGEVPVPDDQLPVGCRDLRGADLAPKGVSPLAAADATGSTSTARSAAARPSATPTRWTRSSTRRGTSCATARRTTSDGPFDVGGGAPLDAGRPVRRRRRARHPAPAVQPVLHQGAARHGDGGLRRAVHAGC